MLLSKQEKVLELFTSGKYKAFADLIFYRERKTGQWKPLVGNKLNSNYTQLLLSTVAPYGKKELITCYKHVAIYIANYGLYPEGFEIDHSDRNNENDYPINLKPKTRIENLKNTERIDFKQKRFIRTEEIIKIKQYIIEGKGNSFISRELDLNRTTVIGIVNKIKRGDKLKYE